MADDANARRARRKNTWTFQRFGPGEEEAMAEADRRFWLKVPVEQRMALTWQLSWEAYGDDTRPRLPRSEEYRLVRYELDDPPDPGPR